MQHLLYKTGGEPIKALNISEVRNRLPTLIEVIAQTREPVVVMRYGAPMAMIVPVARGETEQARYPLRGQPISVTDDFDDPMPDLWSALAVAEKPDAYVSAKRPGRLSKKGVKP